MENQTKHDHVRLQLLKILEKNPQLSQRELAKETGISLGKLNYCLKGLIEVGLIKATKFARSNDKKGYLYLVTPNGVSEKVKLTRAFLVHKQKLYEELKKEIQNLKKDADYQ